MNFGEFRNGRAQQALPAPLSSNESKIAGFEKSCHNLCIRLLRLFAIGLKVCLSAVSLGTSYKCDFACRWTLIKAGPIGLLLVTTQ